MLKAGVCGAGGRMGRLLVRAVLAAKDCELVGALEAADNPNLGEEVVDGCAVKLRDDPQEFFENAEAVIDFSTADATAKLAILAAEHGRPLVIGTTGFDDKAKKILGDMARRIPILVAANMSKGIKLLRSLTATAAQAVDWDIEILDVHHSGKRDAPSGTALALGEEAAAARGEPPPPSVTRNGERQAGEIGYASIRGGNVVGEHSVELIGNGERIIIKHIATDRSIYASGAVEALRWLAGRPPGFYTIDDCFG